MSGFPAAGRIGRRIASRHQESTRPAKAAEGGVADGGGCHQPPPPLLRGLPVEQICIACISYQGMLENWWHPPGATRVRRVRARTRGGTSSQAGGGGWTVDASIVLTDEQDAYISTLVASGRYASVSAAWRCFGKMRKRIMPGPQRFAR
jgi:hypothetical protein